MADIFEKEALYNLIKICRRIEPHANERGWDIKDVFMKIMEETGEFAEATQIELGSITNKEAEYNGPTLEAADVIICVVDALSRLYPNKPASELYVDILSAIDKKSEKWETKVMEKK